MNDVVCSSLGALIPHVVLRLLRGGGVEKPFLTRAVGLLTFVILHANMATAAAAAAAAAGAAAYVLWTEETKFYGWALLLSWWMWEISADNCCW